jgi:hypothetical protein
VSEGEHEHWHPGLGAVLDIGDDVGALVLYTDERFHDREIEISLEGEARRTHTAIHERRVGELVVYAGIYPELRAGRYRVWADDPALPSDVTVVGGQVSELDWRPFLAGHPETSKPDE